ncbi:helix-turn-helix domain-containing protein [Paenibacillus hodogayensis]|uniref:Helix-turn-helix domain-containing protein n=1 Tax=Paenibacillus hodogayensis TaxID=279208 RepID=A0ABV5VS80_9BACL
MTDPDRRNGPHDGDWSLYRYSSGSLPPTDSAHAESPTSPLRLAVLEWSARSYTYWESKREFALPVDTYPTWCLFAVEQGSFAYRIGEEQGIADSGSLVLCPPSVAFGRRMITEDLTFHFVLLTLLSEAWRAADWKNVNKETGPPLPVRFEPENRQRLFDTFGQWRRCGSLALPDRLSFITHYWNDIWKTWCLERIRPDRLADDEPCSDKLMLRAARRLEQQCSVPFGVKELAGELGLSPVQLIRRFRAAYRITPGDYLTGLRLERACRLLRESRMTVEQIAASCGYATGYYLSRLFAARFGIVPSEYRKRHRV